MWCWCFHLAVLDADSANAVVMVQASESRSMRGMKRTAADAAARFKQQQAAGNANGGVLDSAHDDSAHGELANGAAKPVNGDNRNGV